MFFHVFSKKNEKKMKKINGKKISLCSNAQDRMRWFACLQDCLLTLTCHLATSSSSLSLSMRVYVYLFDANGISFHRRVTVRRWFFYWRDESVVMWAWDEDKKVMWCLLRAKKMFFIRGKVRLKRIHIDGCRYNERLNAKTEGSKRLGYTGLRG